MVRTVISLSEKEKEWLDRQAASEGVPMTELVRRAVALLRRRMESEDPPLDLLLERTRGIGDGVDGLERQKNLRDDWA